MSWTTTEVQSYGKVKQVIVNCGIVMLRPSSNMWIEMANNDDE